MKRLIALICSVIFVMSLMVACGNNEDENNAPTQEPNIENTVSGAAGNPDNITEVPAVTKGPTEAPTATPEPTPLPDVWDDNFPSLAEFYKDYFSIGIAICRPEAINELKREVIVDQFNSLTCGNEMKADYVLDREASILGGTEECPVLNFNNAKAILDFCYENNIPMRGHTLVWHSQTPRWFFTEGYSNDPNAPFVTKEVMLKRMENYIRLEMEYFNTNYPGLIYAWDVVNEAVDTGAGVNGYRSDDSYYYQVIGEEYIEKAFEYARKYAAPEQKLFYNDFNTHETTKMYKIIEILEPLVEKGIIDGVGLQSHHGLSSPSSDDIERSIRKYAELGIEIHITELDVDATDNSEETQMKLAVRYKRLFFQLMNLKDQGLPITNVTIWGLTDDGSWLNDETPSWPLLFTQVLEAKPAFWGAIQDESIPLF